MIKRIKEFKDNLIKYGFTIDVDPDKINNVHEKIRYTCNTCMYNFETSVRKLLHNSPSCGRCTSRVLKDNEYFDKQLREKNGKCIRVGEYVGARSHIEVECIKCKHRWNGLPDNLINKGKSCLKCAVQQRADNKRLSNKEVDKRLLDSGFELVGGYVTTTSDITVRCLDCKHEFSRAAMLFVQHSISCEMCGPKVAKNEKRIHQVVKKSGIEYRYNWDIRNLGSERYCRVDFYFPKIRTAIEYNGEQHYEVSPFFGSDKMHSEVAFSKQLERDKYVKNFFDNNQIDLIVIDGREYRNFKLLRYAKKLINELKMKEDLCK